MTKLKQVLMEMDNITSKEADILIDEIKDLILFEDMNPEDVFNDIGLPADYAQDLGLDSMIYLI